ncbi:uncharacterized protein LOC122651019 [Telopea speciosissima]|uniref:uncharacterized protein LOC122651019 n=1 Tax=Telopea speciosissima TaxID=54955 RepID=UPI001CC4B461|nr:uncharacterized protein LOC122651019 [Telopea speciosissima]
MVFGRKVWHPNEVIADAEKEFQEYMSVQTATGSSNTISTHLVSHQWIAPHVDYVKCNSDASLSSVTNKSGVGYICRDHCGTPLFAFSSPIFFSDLLVGETIAVRMAMLELISNDYTHVMIETDNLNLVTYVTSGGGTSPLHIRAIVEDIIHLSSFFVSCSFTCIQWEINSVADSLARRALSLTCTTD